MRNWLFSLTISCALLFAGCASPEFNKDATDVALSGTGGVLGYKLSNGNPAITAAGAAAGYVVSKVAQSSNQKSVSDAEKEGYDRAMNQAVKQQYWIIQNRQKAPAIEGSPQLIQVNIPETKINGVIIQSHVEFLRFEQ